MTEPNAVTPDSMLRVALLVARSIEAAGDAREPRHERRVELAAQTRGASRVLSALLDHYQGATVRSAVETGTLALPPWAVPHEEVSSI